MSDHVDRAAKVTTERVRSKFATVLDDTSGWRHSEAWERDFDRWLTAHDRAVAAKALREAGDDIPPWRSAQHGATRLWLHQRADRIAPQGHEQEGLNGLA